ncbi:MAG: GNAT family N-acetyltransferase [Geoalkalibacter sp.]|uniref:GNAT family N-acetyltransferase n=1 Tax=Geoalkalibacter sp. TaxID=3041440 RepID=UPI003D140BCB
MDANELETLLISSVEDLSPYLDRWRHLAAGSPTRSPEWLLTWWEVYAEASDCLSVLVFQGKDKRLVGLAPLYLHASAKGERIIRFLGSGEVCTNHATWLAVSDWETRIGAEVARFIHQSSNCSHLFLEAVDEDDAAIRATLTSLRAHGYLVHERRVQSCWKIPLPATWEEYLQTLSRSLRKKCRKLQREFFDSGRVRLHVVACEKELEEGFDILLKLHAARWGDSRTPLGVFSSERFLNFHRLVSRKLLAQDQLRLAWLECDGSPVAVEYQFVEPDSVYAYQAGIDLAMDRYSPGKLTMMAAIQFAIAHGCRYLDLSRGDEPYKSHWRAVPTGCYDIRVWPNSGISVRLCYLGWNLHSLVVRWGKLLLPEAFIRFGLHSLNSLRRSRDGGNSNPKGDNLGQ